MELVIKKSERVLAEGGIVYLLFTLEMPEVSGESKTERRLRGFYNELARLYHAAAESYFDAEKAAYERDGDPKKRFTHRPLRLVCRAHIKGMEPYEIERSVCLLRGGSVIWRHTLVDAFDRERGLLPEKRAKKQRDASHSVRCHR